MKWISILELLYGVIVFIVVVKIIYDTRSVAKALGFILLVILVPFFGIGIYLLIGLDYRRSKIYEKKLVQDLSLYSTVDRQILEDADQVFNHHEAGSAHNKKLVKLLANQIESPLTQNNEVTLLNNGENKFPAVLEALRTAKDHIHLEYYTYQSDSIGQQIEEVMIEKAKAGVTVRFIYDDVGSRSIRKKTVNRLRDAGVKAYPFYEVKFWALGRANYRNHRKIVVVDGLTAFIGGINVSDDYINKKSDKDKLFWRDAHLKVRGAAVYYLQFIFLTDWNFCSDECLDPTPQLFPTISEEHPFGDKLVQIAASGPDSKTATIQHSLLQAIHLADKEVLITTPYFIPGESLMDALIIAAYSGIDIKLLVPEKSDSRMVDAAAASYFDPLLSAGIEIYRYKKGFIHSKTAVMDGEIGIIGTANMDIRSFDLNFEVNAVIYDIAVADQLREDFYQDLESAEKIDPEKWKKRTKLVKFGQRVARLFSPIL